MMGIAFGQLAEHHDPEKLIEAMPATPYYLFQWPDASKLGSDKQVNASAKAVAIPKKQSWRWIRSVLDPDWLPPKDTEMIFLREEFHDRDATRLQWERDDYRIEVSQTRTVFALRLTPVKGGTGRGRDKRFEVARDLARKVFSDSANMADSQGNTIDVAELKKRIASYSFNKSHVQELPKDKAVIGLPTTMKDEGTENSNGREEARDVTKTAQAWSYWFRNIRWWNDGESVGFYFLKLDGVGARVVSYVGRSDVNWFRD
jgi:hypothetical protein